MRWNPPPEPGTRICLGFDGSENNDWTAIRAETEEGLQFTPRYGPDKRATIWNPEEWEDRIPRGEVHAAVSEIFETYEVQRMYADPQDWRSEIGEWALKYGEKCVFEWPTNHIRRMYAAIRRFEVDLANGRITHDGCPLTALAIAGAIRAAKPGQMYVLAKAADHMKIDPAMASVLAHEAAMDAVADGWKQHRQSSAIVFGTRRRRRLDDRAFRQGPGEHDPRAES